MRHTGTGIARRQAFHERQREERVELEAAGGAVLPAEKEGIALIDAATVLGGVDEYGPNYIRSRPKEKKTMRRKRQREEAEARQQQAEAETERGTEKHKERQRGGEGGW